MVVGIYIRVSTREQAEEGYSIPAQKERLIAYCKAQGWDDYKLYVDEGVSAKDMNRPKVQLLLNDVKSGKIDMILVYRLDRFTRRVADLYKILQLLDEHKCSFKSATELYDTSNAMGRMFIGLVALLAQWEAENMSERISFALEKKVTDGERSGATPFGFDLVDGKLIKNSDGRYLKEIISKIESGYSATKTAKHLESINNNRNWTHVTVIRILRNVALYGSTQWNGKIIDNTHEGYITKEHFIKLQKILDDRAQAPKKEVKSIYLFQGTLKCPKCGNVLSVHRFFNKRADGTTNQGCVYRCTPCVKKKTGKGVGESHFKKALIEFMKSLNFDNIEPIEDENKDEVIITTKRIESIQRKREKYQRAWASDLITDEEFDARMNETKEHLDELKRKLVESEPKEQINKEALKEIVITFNDFFSDLKREEQKQFIQTFVRKIDFEYVENAPATARSKRGVTTIKIKNVDFY
ncbi:hypothetical protein BK128_08330 [Viridibacillus sp. FSL H7-0596]|uniref:recombinase family protein n=1 Tax=Viridibacillus sp. FSL H7-0596 TaxID=1928923 RepID=UPI00096E2623|nr:recombinase family protein [Viridibacillus sp. FSL H7-0596]OMC87425.1 hypothetical protein BK128_08330 [Viridibacillus sp. FSL H7-0596]